MLRRPCAESPLPMTSLIAFLRVNARWLAAGVLLTFASSFGQTFFISVFSAEIRAAYGLSNGEWGGIYTLATMAAAVAMVFAGGVTDRFRVRHVGGAVAVGLAGACLIMALSASVWGLIAAVFALRLMGQGMMGHTAMVAMARWFHGARGRALSIAGLGVSLGEASLPITFAALMGVAAWRDLWIAAAVIVLAAAPLLARLLHRERTPQSFVATEGSVGMDGRDWTRAEVLRHRMFWMMVPALLGPAAWNTAFFFNQVNFAASKGWTHLSLVALFPIYTLCSVASMLATGWAVDRFGCARLAGLFLIPAAAGYGALAAAHGPAMAALGLALIAATAGAGSTLASAFWAEFFGTRHLGKIRAMTAAVMVLGSALGPGISGVLIDAGITFARQGYGIAVYFAVAAMLAGAGAMGARGALPARA